MAKLSKGFRQFIADVSDTGAAENTAAPSAHEEELTLADVVQEYGAPHPKAQGSDAVRQQNMRTIQRGAQRIGRINLLNINDEQLMNAYAQANALNKNLETQKAAAANDPRLLSYLPQLSQANALLEKAQGTIGRNRGGLGAGWLSSGKSAEQLRDEAYGQRKAGIQGYEDYEQLMDELEMEESGDNLVDLYQYGQSVRVRRDMANVKQAAAEATDAQLAQMRRDADPGVLQRYTRSFNSMLGKNYTTNALKTYDVIVGEQERRAQERDDAITEAYDDIYAQIDPENGTLWNRLTPEEQQRALEVMHGDTPENREYAAASILEMNAEQRITGDGAYTFPEQMSDSVKAFNELTESGRLGKTYEEIYEAEEKERREGWTAAGKGMYTGDDADMRAMSDEINAIEARIDEVNDRLLDFPLGDESQEKQQLESEAAQLQNRLNSLYENADALSSGATEKTDALRELLYGKGNVFDLIGKSVWQGFTNFADGFYKTADFIIGRPINYIGQKITGDSEWKNTFSKWTGTYSKGVADPAREAVNHAVQALGGGKGWEIFANTLSGLVENIPNTAMAIMTGGAANAAGMAGLQRAAIAEMKAAGYTTSAAMKAIQSAISDPQYWTYFLQTAGPDYQEALEATGGDDLKASLYSMLSSLINAEIEIGGDGKSGIQGLGQGNDGGIWNKAVQAVIGKDIPLFAQILDSATDEGMEELKQGLVSGLAWKAIVDSQSKWLSFTPGESAVLNVPDAGNEMLQGAVTGGLLAGVTEPAANRVYQRAADAQSGGEIIGANYATALAGIAEDSAHIHNETTEAIKNGTLDMTRKNSRAKVGKLYRETYAKLDAGSRAALNGMITEPVRRQLEATGYSGDAAAAAETIAKEYRGEELSARELAVYDDPAAAQVAAQLFAGEFSEDGQNEGIEIDSSDVKRQRYRMQMLEDMDTLNAMTGNNRSDSESANTNAQEAPESSMAAEAQGNGDSVGANNAQTAQPLTREAAQAEVDRLANEEDAIFDAAEQAQTAEEKQRLGKAAREKHAELMQAYQALKEKAASAAQETSAAKEQQTAEAAPEAQQDELPSSAITVREDHTEEQKKTIRSYLQSVNEKVRQAAEAFRNNKNAKYQRISLQQVNPREAEDIQRLTGADVSDYTHDVDTNFFNHVEKRHGLNGIADKSMADLNDVARVGWVIENYDTIEFSEEEKASGYLDASGTNMPMIAYKKKLDGTVYVVEAVGENKWKKLHVVTAYIQKKNPANESQGLALQHTLHVTSPKLTSETGYAPSANATVAQEEEIVNPESSPEYAETARQYALSGRSWDELTETLRDAGAEVTDSVRAAYDQGESERMERETKRQQQIMEAREKANGGRRGVLRSISQEEADAGGVNAIQGRLSGKQRAAVTALRGLAESTGLNIVLYESKTKNGARSGREGWYDPKSGTVYIDVYAGYGNEEAMLRAAGHELTHFIADWSPAQYARLRGYLLERYYENDSGTVKQLIQHEMDLDATLTEEEAMEEVVCRACETMLSDGEAVRKLAQKHTQLFMRIRGWLDTFCKAIQRAWHGLGAHSEAARLLGEAPEKFMAAQRVWYEALEEASVSLRGEAREIMAENARAEKIAALREANRQRLARLETERQEALKRAEAAQALEKAQEEIEAAKRAEAEKKALEAQEKRQERKARAEEKQEKETARQTQAHARRIEKYMQRLPEAARRYVADYAEQSAISLDGSMESGTALVKTALHYYNQGAAGIPFDARSVTAAAAAEISLAFREQMNGYGRQSMRDIRLEEAAKEAEITPEAQALRAEETQETASERAETAETEVTPEEQRALAAAAKWRTVAQERIKLMSSRARGVFMKWAANEDVNVSIEQGGVRAAQFANFAMKWYNAGKKGTQANRVAFDAAMDSAYPPFLQDVFYREGQTDAQESSGNERRVKNSLHPDVPLTEEQYQRNRAEVTQMQPVRELNGDEFVMDNGTLVADVLKYYQEEYNGQVYVPYVGDVTLDKKGMWNSRGHGMTPLKAAAYAAVPEVLMNGRIVEYTKAWKEQQRDTIVVAAPITVGNEKYLMGVIVNRPHRSLSQRYYTHDAVAFDIIKMGQPAIQTANAQAKGGGMNGDYPTLQKLLQNIVNVNSEKEQTSESGADNMRVRNSLRDKTGAEVFMTQAEMTEKRKAVAKMQPIDATKDAPASSRFLNGDFVSEGKKYFEEVGGTAYNETLGEVILSASGLRHIVGRKNTSKIKAETLAAIKPVIEQGEIVYCENNHKGKPIDTATIAGRVMLPDGEYLVGVIVAQDNGGTRGQKNRYSFHTAFAIKEEPAAGSIGNNAFVASSTSPSTLSILQEVNDYKTQKDGPDKGSIGNNAFVTLSSSPSTMSILREINDYKTQFENEQRARAKEIANILNPVEDQAGTDALEDADEERKVKNSLRPDVELTEEQYQRNRAEVTKMKPVKALVGNEFVMGTETLSEEVLKYYQEEYNGRVDVPSMGEVALDKKGIKSSRGHGMIPIKAAAYAAVPEVLMNGRIVDYAKGWKGQQRDTIVVAAPITVKNEKYLMGVIVNRPHHTFNQGYYTHEAVDFDIIKMGKTTIQTVDAEANRGGMNGSYPTLGSLLQSILDVNSKIEQTGESRTVMPGMSDGERYEVLRGAQIEVQEAARRIDAEELRSFSGMDYRAADKPLAALARRFGLIAEGDRTAMALKNKYLPDVTARFSRSSLNESIQKQRDGLINMAALMPVFAETYRNAVPIMKTGDRYMHSVKENSSVEGFVYLLGGFSYNGSIIPVQFELKRIKSAREEQLYVVATIKKDAITAVALQNANHTTTASSVVSIEDIIQFVNQDEEEILAYLPAQFLNKEQLAGKREELQQKGIYLRKKAVAAGKDVSAPVTMTEERIDAEIERNGARYSPDYSKAYMTFIDPAAFIRLTASDAQRIQNESRALAADELRENEQTPFLCFDMQTGEITGHEGRHRMAALANAGVRRVAILMRPDGSEGRYARRTLDALRVQGKNGSEETLQNLIPVNEKHREALLAAYGEGKRWFNYSQRDTDERSDRQLLAEAFMGLAKTENERKALERYKEKIAQLDADSERIAQLRRVIHDKTFKRGETDRAGAERARLEIQALNERVTKADKALLRMERGAALRRVLETERREAERKKAEKIKGQLKRYREGVESREYKERIKKASERLAKWIAQPDKNNHVPKALRASIAGFVLSIRQGAGTEFRGQGGARRERNFLENLRQLQGIVSDVSAYQFMDADERVQADFGMYLDLPEGFSEQMAALIRAVESEMGTEREFSVDDMTLEQLRQLYQILSTVSASVTQANELLALGGMKHVSEAAQSSIAYIRSAGRVANGAPGSVHNFLSWDNLQPVRAFERMGEGGQAIFRGLQKGQAKLAYNVREALRLSDEAYSAQEARAWSREIKTFNVGGREIRMPVADVMSLHCLMKRAQAAGHILGEGFRVADFKDGRKTVAGEGTTITQEEARELTNSLTDRQREVADRLQEIMSSVGSRWGNEVSMKRFGYEMFTERSYFPIEVDGDRLTAKTDESRGNELYRLLNISSVKPITRGARNRVMLKNIFEVYASHMSDMAQYNAMGLPVLDAVKWINYREGVERDDGTVSTEGVRDALRDVYGNAAGRYVIKLLKDVNGTQATGDVGEALSRKMLTRYNRQAVAANLSVALKQPMSIIRAGMELGGSDLVLGELGRKGTFRQNVREMLTYSGIAVWKDLGFYDVNVSRPVKAMIMHSDSAADEIISKATFLAEGADKITWAAMWGACKRFVERSGQRFDSTEDFMHAVADKFEDVIYKTQVVDSILTRSQFMRGTSFQSKAFSSFMSEPTTTYNMLLAAAHSFVNDMRKGDSFGRAFVKNGRIIGRTALVYFLSAATMTVLEALIGAWRDDDDYETFMEKFKAGLLDYAVDEFMPASLLPVVSDLYDYGKKLVSTIWPESGISGYGTSSAVYAAAEDITDLVSIIKKMEAGTTGYTVYGAAYKAAKAISEVTGMPIAPAMREVVALWNNTAAVISPNLRLETYESSVNNGARALYQAITAGDEEREVTVRAQLQANGHEGQKLNSAVKSVIREELEANRITEKQAQEYLMQLAEMESDDAYFQTQKWQDGDGSYSRFDKLEQAIKSGTGYQAAVQELTGHGYTLKEVQSTARSTIAGMAINDGMTEIRIRQLLRQYGGLTENEAYIRSQELRYEQLTGSKTTADTAMVQYAIDSKTSPKAAIDGLLKHGKEKSSIASSITNRYKEEYLSILRSGKTGEASALKGRLITVFDYLGYDGRKKVEEWEEKKKVTQNK